MKLKVDSIYAELSNKGNEFQTGNSKLISIERYAWCDDKIGYDDIVVNILEYGTLF